MYLSPRTESGHVYYEYRFPNGKRKTISKDRKLAIQVAEQLNAKRADDEAKRILSRLTGRTSVAEICDLAMQAKIDELRTLDKEIAPSTREEYEIAFRSIKKVWEHEDPASISISQCRKYLSGFTRSVQVRRLVHLRFFFETVISQGLREENPAAGIKIKKRKKTRARLSMSEFDKIYAEAPDWLQRAMRISLLTGQAPVDVCKMRWSDIVDGRLRIARQKLERKHAGLVEITPGPELLAELEKCRAVPWESPFIVTTKYQRRRARFDRECEHQLNRQYLSEAFMKVRDRLGIQAKIKKDDRASFGEIRSLASLRTFNEAMRKTKELLAHETEGMTAHYLAGHDEIEYSQAVSA